MGNLSGVYLVNIRKADEHRHIGGKSDTEKPLVNGEERIAAVPNRLGMLLLNAPIIEITAPVENSLCPRYLENSC